MAKARKKLCDKLFVFSILFFITSLLITSLGSGADTAGAVETQERAPSEAPVANIQVQQKQIHERLTQIETRLDNPRQVR